MRSGLSFRPWAVMPLNGLQLLTSRIHRSKDTTTGEYFLIINSLFCRGELSIADPNSMPPRNI